MDDVAAFNQARWHGLAEDGAPYTHSSVILNGAFPLP